MNHGAPDVRIAMADSPSAAAEWIESWQAEHAGGRAIAAPSPAEWPFRYPLAADLPDGPVVVRANAFDEAFVNRQTGGVQLVTTQRAYLEAEWAAALERHTAGAWLLLVSTPAPQHHSTSALLPRAFRCDEAGERLRLCLEALASGRTPAALVATASVCMEVNDLAAATRDLDEALRLAPHWAAARSLTGVRAGLGQPGRHTGRAGSPRRGAGRVRTRPGAGPGQPPGPEQCGGGPPRVGAPQRVGSGVPAGD
jgi:hypothetical protein